MIILVKSAKNIAEIVEDFTLRPKARTPLMTRRRAKIKSLDAAVAVCSANVDGAAEITSTIAYVANSVSSGLQAESKPENTKKASFASYFGDKVSYSYKALQKKARKPGYYFLNKMMQRHEMDVVKETKLKIQRFYLCQNPAYFVG